MHVVSSEIVQMGWEQTDPQGTDNPKGILFIQYRDENSVHGPAYLYTNIPFTLYRNLQDIARTKLVSGQQVQCSLGSNFNYIIRIHPNKYPYQKLTEEELIELLSGGRPKIGSGSSTSIRQASIPD
jgi:hypothetical protein